jgi:hypothetical protein
VEVSADSGKTWQPARLGKDLGRYAWRRWHYSFTPQKPGSHFFMVKATNIRGETQPPAHWNRSGYMRNAIESLELTATK